MLPASSRTSHMQPLTVPKTMKRCVLATPNEDMSKVVLKIENLPVPVPKANEVLIRVAAAPINPSDFGVWLSSSPEKCPMPIGKEGSGVVVSMGGGQSTLSYGVGTKVGFTNLPNTQGAYSEYVTVSASMGVFPMPDDLEIERAASFYINPYAVVGILETVQQLNTSAMVHTAASSQVGQMLVKLAKSRNVTLINIVRREEQAKLLRSLGAEHVVVAMSEDWETALSNLIKAHKVKVAFDAIGGLMTGKLISLLPAKSTCFVYGGLSREPVGGIDSIDLIYNKKEVKGWLLNHWVQAVGMPNRLRAAAELVNPGLQSGGWAESTFEDCNLDDFRLRFLELYNSGGFTNRKLRVRMRPLDP